LLGPGPRLIKKEFTGPRSHKGRETLDYWMTLRKGEDAVNWKMKNQIAVCV